MQDPWDTLTDHEAAALERSEEKYKMLGPQASPFPDAVPLCTAQILRVNFAAFRDGDSIHVHADRSRLNPLCEIGRRVWLPELRGSAERGQRHCWIRGKQLASGFESAHAFWFSAVPGGYSENRGPGPRHSRSRPRSE